MPNWDLDGNECKSVGRFTLNEGSKRGDWMKHWMMQQGYNALNTMYKKTLQKQTTSFLQKGKKNKLTTVRSREGI